MFDAHDPDQLLADPRHDLAGIVVLIVLAVVACVVLAAVWSA